MKRNTVILWLIAPLMLIGVILSVYLQPTIICAFQGGDSLNEAACVTEVKLNHYGEAPEQAIEWLLADHGEALSAQVMVSLTEWAMKEPESFVDLLSTIREEDVAPFLRLAAEAVHGSVGTERFVALMAKPAAESTRLRQLLDLLT